MRYFVTLPSGEEVSATVVASSETSLTLEIGGRTLAVDRTGGASPVSLRVDGRSVDLYVDRAGRETGELRVSSRGYRGGARIESERERLGAKVGGAKSGAGLVKSPMPGRVLKVLVAVGDDVAAGAPLVVVEAMKMENELVAKRAGRVTGVFVAPGATVEGGAKLVEIA